MAGITLVQAVSGTGTTSPVNITLAATGSKNCIVVCVGEANSSTNPTVSGITLGGSADNFAVVSGTQVINNADTNVEIWTDQGCAGGQTALSVSFNAGTGTGNGYTVWVFEFSGVATTNAVDLVNSGGAGSGAWSSGSTGTLSQPNEVVVGLGAASGSVGAPSLTGPSSPWINEAQVSAAKTGMLAGYQIVTSTTALTYSGTTSTGRSGAAIVSLKAAPTAGTTTPVLPLSNISPYPLSVNGMGLVLIPQRPANYPNTYDQGTTANETVASAVSASISKTGLAANDNARAVTGNVHIQTVFNPPFPFANTAPYPLNITLGAYRIQPQVVPNTGTPATVVLGITAQASISAPTGNISVTNAAVYNWSFPLANNVPYPLSIINRNVKPQVPGQPQQVVKGITSAVTATANTGTVNISLAVTANVSISATSGSVFIRSVTQYPFPFTHYPHPLKLMTLQPQYSSGKQQLPTNIHGAASQDSVAAVLGNVSIGQHVPGFVSNVFPATVPGTTSVVIAGIAANVNVKFNLPAAKSNYTGQISSVTAVAYFGKTSVIQRGITASVNVNPEYGSVHAGDSFTGTASSVTASAITGKVTIGLHITSNVSAAAIQSKSESKTGLTSSVTAQAKLGTVKISQSLVSNVIVASSVHVKVSPSVNPAKISAKSSAVTRVSVSPANVQVTASSVAGTKTTIGETSSVTSVAPKGTATVKITGNNTNVQAKANNEGKVVAGQVSTVTSAAHIGGISTGFTVFSAVSVNAHLGIAGTSSIDVNVLNTWFARLEDGD